ncbi:MAG: aminoglycoside phosphotransferase family protein [Alphaproteobacteria bacterium]
MSFQGVIGKIYGELGLQWFENLPQQIEKISKKYNLSPLKPIPNLTHHYVLSGYQNNKSIILKLGFDSKDLDTESKSLKLFEGFGAVHLLAAEKGMILLEKLEPGTTLKNFSSIHKNKIEIACGLLSEMKHAPISYQDKFPSLNDWLVILDQPWPIPELYLEKARHLKTKLLNRAYPIRLIHGDFHDENILFGENKWWFIDPKPVIGSPEYDVATFIRNSLQGSLSKDTDLNNIKLQVQSFSNLLGMEFDQLKQWCFLQSILAWVWAIEDNMEKVFYQEFCELFFNLNN